MLFHGAVLESRLNQLGARILAIAGLDDMVITAAGMERNLRPLQVRGLKLGIHEFPFTIAGPLTGVYDRRQPATRTVIKAVKNSQAIPPSYRAAFAAFVHEIETFFHT